MEVSLEGMGSGVRILVTNHDGSIVCKGGKDGVLSGRYVGSEEQD
jgi:hypothetical protein